MKVKRKITVETNDFQLGDKISFTLTTGEKVEAKAVRRTKHGMLFITTDCLKQEYPMFKSLKGRKADEIKYANSDLRRHLADIAGTFPEEIRSMMVPVYEGDFLRIPRKKEIFESENSKKLFKGMRQRKNITAMKGYRSETLVWYWLMDKTEGSASFLPVSAITAVQTRATLSYSRGVRPVFCLSCI